MEWLLKCSKKVVLKEAEGSFYEDSHIRRRRRKPVRNAG